MILDNILQEQSTYTEDSMVDMFVEGFLYALEMQEEGKKASSMEELSNTLSEAANEAISEVNPYVSTIGHTAATSIGTDTIKLAAMKTVGRGAATGIGATVHISELLFGKIARKIIRKLKCSDKYKDNEYAKKLSYPVKNKILALGLKLLLPNILFQLKVPVDEKDKAKKFIDNIISDANKEYKGIINHIEVKTKEDPDNNGEMYFLITRSFKNPFKKEKDNDTKKD